MKIIKGTVRSSEAVEIKTLYSLFIVCICLWVSVSGCVGIGTKVVGPTQMHQAQQDFPEEELLDVGIAVFEGGQLDKQSNTQEDQEVNPNVRKAESHYIAYHLKNTIQQSGYWGSVWVTPVEDTELDLMVNGGVLESNGKNLTIQIRVVDASGKVWLDEIYETEVGERAYNDNELGERDAFQDIYNAIANDLSAFKQGLSTEEIKEIRSVSKLRFADELAPDAFENYLIADDSNTLSIIRLPADDDPMISRILTIREREYMYFDALNGYYEAFYADMWPKYVNWRKSDLTERIAREKVEREAMANKIGGALLILMGAALEISDVDTGALAPIMILGGGKIFIDGVNISKQTEIHSAAIEELGESFGSDMKPVIIDLEGRQYELTGTAEEQFAKWRLLLREIYYAETGFDPKDASRLLKDIETTGDVSSD